MKLLSELRNFLQHSAILYCDRFTQLVVCRAGGFIRGRENRIQAYSFPIPEQLLSAELTHHFV
jgi:hypothetical protein